VSLAGPVAFIVVSLLLSVATAGAIGDAELATSALGRWPREVFLFVAFVGWQPIVALVLAASLDRSGARDLGTRVATPRAVALAITLGLGVVAAAAVVRELTGIDPVGEPLRELVAIADREGGAMVLGVGASCAALLVLWIFVVLEELAWRGYLLPRLVEVTGVWAALAIHGALWGLCYAPAVMMASGPTRAAQFVVTSTLLGVVLGQVRFLAGASVAATAKLAIVASAGLPRIVLGEHAPLDAVFGPAGWIPLVVVIVHLGGRLGRGLARSRG